MYPENKAIYTEHTPKYSIFLVHTGNNAHYCGYVRFPNRFLLEEGYNGILTYAPVHGGITYAESDENGMVYGFDCAHAGDEHDPLCKDPGWLKRECHRMATSILIAAKWEQFYTVAKNNDAKANVIAAYCEELATEYDIHFVLDQNFGTMIRILCGEL